MATSAQLVETQKSARKYFYVVLRSGLNQYGAPMMTEKRLEKLLPLVENGPKDNLFSFLPHLKSPKDFVANTQAWLSHLLVVDAIPSVEDSGTVAKLMVGLSAIQFFASIHFHSKELCGWEEKCTAKSESKKKDEWGIMGYHTLLEDDEEVEERVTLWKCPNSHNWMALPPKTHS